MVTNDILVAVSLLENVQQKLKPNTREAISRTNLSLIRSSIANVNEKIIKYTKDDLILMPIIEAIELIDLVLSDPSMRDTDMESKDLLIEKVNQALHYTYMFAGTFYYKDNEFKRTSPMLDNLLINSVNANIEVGFYFGLDEEVKHA